ncbi:MAG: DUF4058 family protein [Gemmataceae bacterium]
MPIHDWTRVTAGTWHAFHVSWIGELQLALNDGGLPTGYYALAEQDTGPFGPDVLTLPEAPIDPSDGPEATAGTVAVATAPPRTRITDTGEIEYGRRKRRTLTVRHTSDDRVVALIEIVSPGNKAARRPFAQFLRKAAESLRRGFHRLVVDLFPPTRRDPEGIHQEIWVKVRPNGIATPLPPDEPLTLASYVAGPNLTAYVEPVAVGKSMMDMPLFLTAERYVNVPLEATYAAAFRGVPAKYKRILS